MSGKCLKCELRFGTPLNSIFSESPKQHNESFPHKLSWLFSSMGSPMGTSTPKEVTPEKAEQQVPVAEEEDDEPDEW